jgi:protein TonB
VQIIRPPPPPPEETPPPPPDQPKEEVPLDSPEPKDAADDPTPSEQLALDADGTAGGDAFGLAAHKGGRDLAGSGGAAFAWYTGRLRDHVDQRLGGDARLKARKFSVTVKIWIQTDGHIQDVQLASTTGNHDLDQAIQAALISVGNIGESPPIEMPQPISLKIVSRI